MDPVRRREARADDLPHAGAKLRRDHDRRQTYQRSRSRYAKASLQSRVQTVSRRISDSSSMHGVWSAYST
jgi:hypothetical protein